MYVHVQNKIKENSSFPNEYYSAINIVIIGQLIYMTNGSHLDYKFNN